jgi:phosphoribosylformylglycinamidine synthase subunit PurQ / glutaminase
MMAKSRVGVVRFWGTNCDFDVKKWITLAGFEPEFLWFQDQFKLSDYESIVIPGGFSYGDYLRCGALAARSPVMKSVHEFAKTGRPILGICNGFQILCESGLLPGALVRNQNEKFLDRFVDLEVNNLSSYFFRSGKNQTSKIKLPVAHGEGRFYSSADDLKKIQDNDQVWIKYLSDVNGSFNSIAGVKSATGNVFGLMPHPERALYPWMGSSDGFLFLPEVSS